MISEGQVSPDKLAFGVFLARVNAAPANSFCLHGSKKHRFSRTWRSWRSWWT
jgi:hypothetical protein